MTVRVRWTCPECGQLYSIPDTMIDPQCPACTAGMPGQIAATITLTRPQLAGTIAASVAGGFLLGFVSWALLPSRSGAPPTAHIERPQVAATAKDSDKDAVAKLLNENLDDGNWEEVKWWPAVDQSAEVQRLMAWIEKKGPPPVDARNRKWDKEAVERFTNPLRIARLKYRTRNRQGALELRDSVIRFNSAGGVAIERIQQSFYDDDGVALWLSSGEIRLLPSVRDRLEL